MFTFITYILIKYIFILYVYVYNLHLNESRTDRDNWVDNGRRKQTAGKRERTVNRKTEKQNQEIIYL